MSINANFVNIIKISFKNMKVIENNQPSWIISYNVIPKMPSVPAEVLKILFRCPAPKQDKDTKKEENSRKKFHVNFMKVSP